MGPAQKPQAGATLSYSQPRLGHSPPRAIGGLAHRGPAKMAPPLAAINTLRNKAFKISEILGAPERAELTF